jgi:nucleoside-diphosphate-sugar epimerase
MTFGHEVHSPRSWVYDLRKRQKVEQMLQDISPEIVVHLAAVVGGIGVNQARPGRLFYDNVIMGVELMEQARRAGVSKFVTIGTACEYPADAPVPLTEEGIWDGYPALATAPYGMAKKALLVQGQAYRQEYGLNAIHLIPTNLYGPGDNFDSDTGHVVAGMIRKLSDAVDNKDSSVTLWGTGRPTRDFLYVDDAARGIALATEDYDDPEPLNIGTGEELSIGELALMVSQLCGFYGEIVWDASFPDGTPRRCLDTSRARTLIGFEPVVLLDEGLRSTVQWYQAKDRSPAV